MNRYERCKRVAAELREVASKLKITVIVAAQQPVPLRSTSRVNDLRGPIFIDHLGITRT